MNEPSKRVIPASEIICERRTIHNFRHEPVPEYQSIIRAIDLARWAPNHHLTEPWHFYLPGKETVAKICQLNEEIVRTTKNERAARIKLERWQKIPGWLVLTCINSDDPVRAQEDYAACCCTAQNLMLLLWEQGIGMKWTTGEIIRDDRFYDLIHVAKQQETVVGLFWYGFAEDVPVSRRKPLATALTELP